MNIEQVIVELKAAGSQIAVYQSLSACRCLHFTDCSATHICTCGLRCGHKELAEVDYYA